MSCQRANSLAKKTSQTPFAALAPPREPVALVLRTASCWSCASWLSNSAVFASNLAPASVSLQGLPQKKEVSALLGLGCRAASVSDFSRASRARAYHKRASLLSPANDFLTRQQEVCDVIEP